MATGVESGTIREAPHAVVIGSRRYGCAIDNPIARKQESRLMSLIPIIGLGWLLLCAISAASLVLVPPVVLVACLMGKDVWSILTRGRLQFAFLAYLGSAPVPAVFTFLLELGATAGNAGGVASDSEIQWNERFFFVFVAAAAVSGLLLLLRPKDRQAANVEPPPAAR
ncbi:hypothetical protein [Burkholderia cepacia]|uniref:hypothetical protein n=1 Tax=Burkholderia cepacia TaxID=292 RepID=UPI001E469228|nr:hypothetical protein [Burkholderia cepacia]